MYSSPARAGNCGMHGLAIATCMGWATFCSGKPKSTSEERERDMPRSRAKESVVPSFPV